MGAQGREIISLRTSAKQGLNEDLSKVPNYPNTPLLLYFPLSTLYNYFKETFTSFSITKGTHALRT